MKPCVKAHPLRIATTRFITRVARFIRTEFRAFIFLLFFLFLQNHPQFPIVKLYVVSPFHAIFTLFPAIQNKRKSHQNCFNYYFTKLMRVRDRIWISIPIYYYYFCLIWFPHFFCKHLNPINILAKMKKRFQFKKRKKNWIPIIGIPIEMMIKHYSNKLRTFIHQRGLLQSKYSFRE